MKYTSKSFDFFKLCYEDKQGKNYDYSKINNEIQKVYERLIGDKKTEVSFIKCFSSFYTGFNLIKKVDLSDEAYMWVFCLSKVDVQKEAIVNDISKSVSEGRSVYGESKDEGPTVETVILFNPFNGVVIIPRNRSGVGKSLLLNFFYRITRKTGGFLEILINNTTLENIAKIDSMQELEFSIKRIYDPNKLKNNNRKTKKDEEIIDALEADKMFVKYKSDKLNVSKVVGYIKDVFKISTGDKTVDKLIIKGTEGDNEQIIDLISNRLVYVDDKVALNNQGKLTIDSMCKSIEKAYRDNEIILFLDA